MTRLRRCIAEWDKWILRRQKCPSLATINVSAYQWQRHDRVTEYTPAVSLFEKSWLSSRHCFAVLYHQIHQITLQRNKKYSSTFSAICKQSFFFAAHKDIFQCEWYESVIVKACLQQMNWTAVHELQPINFSTVTRVTNNASCNCVNLFRSGQFTSVHLLWTRFKSHTNAGK